MQIPEALFKLLKLAITSKYLTILDIVEQNIVIFRGKQINYLPKLKAEANN